MFEKLAGLDLTGIYIDSIIFLISIIIGMVIVISRFQGSSRYILICYIIITYSASNVFIKMVQDYNIAIPRTFLFYYKLYFGLSIYDIFLLFAVTVVSVKLLAAKINPFKSSGIYSSIFLRDTILFFLGIFGSFLYLKQGERVDWDVYIRSIRGLLTAIVVVWASRKLIFQADNTVKAKSLINIICLLNLVEIASEIISSRFLQNISWERFGHNVYILDQTNYNYLMIYGSVLFTNWKGLDKLYKICAYLVIGILFFDYHKVTYLQTGLVIITVASSFFFGYSRLPKKIVYIFPLFIPLFLFIISQLLTAKTDDIRTRAGQINSVLESFDKHPVNSFVGMGPGGMFKRQSETEEEGEIKAIDIEKYDQYQVAFQTPFLFFFKEQGLLGCMLVIFFLLKNLLKSFRLVKVHWFLAISSIFICVCSITVPTLSYSDPQTAIFYGVGYIFIVLNTMIIREENTLIEKGNLQTRT